MSEEELRQEAVRRRLAGESPSEIAQDLGRTTRWVRKWVARHDEQTEEDWAQSRSRAPHTSPSRTPADVEAQILRARERLVANPRAQYGSLAIAWELRRLRVDPIPPARTIERVLARAGVSRPRRRQGGYVSKGVPYPAPTSVEPGTTHQIDMVGPRHLFGAARFHALNLIDVGSHLAGNEIVTELAPPGLARSLAGIWTRVGIPAVAQFDNHANFRGGIPPAWQHFSPIVATCLDLGVTPRERTVPDQGQPAEPRLGASLLHGWHRDHRPGGGGDLPHPQPRAESNPDHRGRRHAYQHRARQRLAEPLCHRDLHCQHTPQGQGPTRLPAVLTSTRQALLGTPARWGDRLVQAACAV